jgi:hypothetical protein
MLVSHARGYCGCGTVARARCRAAGRAVRGGLAGGRRAAGGGRWLLDQRLGDLASWGLSGPIPHELLVIDDTLRPVWRLRPPPEPVGWRGTHTVADDLSLAALALPGEVRLVDRDGGVVARLPYPSEHEAGYADFTAEGNLWVRFPGRHELLEITADLEVVNRHQASGMREAGGCLFTADRRWLWVFAPSAGEGGGVLWLVRVADKRVVDRRALPDAYAQVVRFYRHPDGHSVCLAVSQLLTAWGQPSQQLRRIMGRRFAWDCLGRARREHQRGQGLVLGAGVGADRAWYGVEQVGVVGHTGALTHVVAEQVQVPGALEVISRWLVAGPMDVDNSRRCWRAHGASYVIPVQRGEAGQPDQS